MNKYKDSWGQVAWWKEQDEDDLIHPADLNSMRNHSPICVIFHCIDEDDEYITVKYGEFIVRIKPELFKQLPVKFSLEVGDWVKVKNTDRKHGVIYAMDWHWKNQVAVFMIRVNGTRKSTTWYHEDDLEKIEPQNMEEI